MKKTYEVHVDGLPVFVWANDGDTLSEYLEIGPAYKKPYHNKMKKVRITVEVIKPPLSRNGR